MIPVVVVAVQGLDISVVEFTLAGTACDAIPAFAECAADNSSEQRLIVSDVQMGQIEPLRVQRGQVILDRSDDAVAAVDIADERKKASVDDITGLAQRSGVLVEEIPNQAGFVRDSRVVGDTVLQLD